MLIPVLKIDSKFGWSILTTAIKDKHTQPVVILLCVIRVEPR